MAQILERLKKCKWKEIIIFYVAKKVELCFGGSVVRV